MQVDGVDRDAVQADADAFQDLTVSMLRDAVEQIVGSLTEHYGPDDMVHLHNVWEAHIDEKLLPQIERAFTDAIAAQHQRVLDATSAAEPDR